MIADVFASISFDGVHPRDPAVAKMLGITPLATSGARVDTRAALGYSPVFRAVNLIGNAVAKCKPIIYRRLEGGDGRDKERAMDHPSWRATVRRANSLMSAGYFRKTITGNAIMEGNGIGYVERDNAAQVLEYIPLLPDRTGMAVFNEKLGEDSPYPTAGNVLYWTIVGNEMRPLLPENIVHIRNFSYNGVWGMNVTDLMRETLGLGLAARESGSRFFGQGMMSSGVLYMPPGMKEEPAQELFAKSVKEQVQGLGRSHRLLVLEEGAKYEKMTVDPEVAQALESRQFSVREVANLIGCQSHKLGDTERTSYASLEQSNQEHLDDDIDPWLMWWEESLEDVALTEREKEEGTHFIECNRNALLRTDLAARTAYYTAGVNGGWLSANRILRIEGDDPIGPQGDIYRWPINMVPAEQADMVSQIDQRPAGKSSKLEDEDDEDDASLATNYRILAMHESKRLIQRVCTEATRKAGKGGAEFVAFIESIPSRCQEPGPLRPHLLAIGARLAHELDRFTQPPYLANDLKSNVEAAAERIQQELVREAAERLERVA